MALETITNEDFAILQKYACELRDTYDDACWYASWKKNRVNKLSNDWDNRQYIISMFDINNTWRLLWMLPQGLSDIVRRNLPHYL